MAARNTRERLLSSAREVLRRRGYSEASVEDIAHAAGLSKGAIYGQFQSKREILLALMDAWTHEAIADLEAGRRRPFEAVRRFIYGSGGRRIWSSLVLEFWRQALDDTVVREHLLRCYGQIETAVAAVLRAWRYPSEAGPAAGRAISLYNGYAAISAFAERRPSPPSVIVLERLLFREEEPPAQPAVASTA